MIHKILRNHADSALLVTRFIIGGIFITSGWMKLADMHMTVSMFSHMGIPSGLAYLVAYGECIGGLLLVIGLWTECAAIFLTVVMIVAVYLTLAGGFQAFALPLAMIAGLSSIMGCGAGKYTFRK